MTQKLSPTARRAKLARDLAFAKTDSRRVKKAENQRLRRKAKRNGRNVDNLDYDHKDNKFKPVSENRAGTKNE